MSSTNFANTQHSHSGALGRHTILIIGTVTVLVAGYALGYVLRPGGAWEQTAHTFEVSGMVSQGSLLYVIAAGVALMLLVALLRSSKIELWRKNPFAGRSEKPIGQFVQEAKQLRISLRVAREAYHLLQHHYPRPMCIDLRDDLRRDLRLTTGNIMALRSGLLGRTDRSELGGYDDGKITSVRHLLEFVEGAPKSNADRAKMRLRVTDLPFSPRPVVENLEFTESSALADPDFLRRAHFKWLRRRTADYTGFRSRAADQGAPQQHPGPFRRATELHRRLSIKQEAGRVARQNAEKKAVEQAEAQTYYDTHPDPTDYEGSTAHHGY